MFKILEKLISKCRSRSFIASLIALFAVQTTSGFFVWASGPKAPESARRLQALERYNAFAKNPFQTHLEGYSKEELQLVRELLRKAAIQTLPQAKLLSSGSFELKGEEKTVQIEPVSFESGKFKMNGSEISIGGSTSLVEQIETIQKNLEKNRLSWLENLLIPQAHAYSFLFVGLAVGVLSLMRNCADTNAANEISVQEQAEIESCEKEISKKRAKISLDTRSEQEQALNDVIKTMKLHNLSISILKQVDCAPGRENHGLCERSQQLKSCTSRLLAHYEKLTEKAQYQITYDREKERDGTFGKFRVETVRIQQAESAQ